MESPPEYIGGIFVIITAVTYGFILFAAYFAFQRKRYPLILFASVMMAWLLLTGVLAFKGFFLDFERIYLFLIVGPVTIVCLLTFPKTRASILKMPITTLTYVHIVRIPVELGIWWLFEAGWVAKGMTFEGANLDIIAGISAPFAAVFLVGRKSNNRIAAILWNLIGLGLVLNIVVQSIQYTPYFYDNSASELQNLAVFPFIWLPCFVMCVIIFSHLASLVKLCQKTTT